MPVFQELIDCDEWVYSLRNPPVIVNDLQQLTEEDREKVDAMITTRYENTDQIEVLPMCRCGKIKGVHAVGVYCKDCDTTVTVPLPEEIEPLIWVRAPKGIHAFVNPLIWMALKNRFTRSGYNVIQWVCDKKYNPGTRMPSVLDKMTMLGIQRGYNYFIENFDFIMETMFSLPEFKLKRNERDYLYELIKRDRKKIFSKYLPLPNKMFLIIEKSNMGVYIDENIPKAIDAIRMMVAIDRPDNEQPHHVIENRTVKMLAKLCEFYDGYSRSNTAGKPGMIRKHILGCRTHFSFRTVISSLTDDHRYDEIHVPWAIGPTAFKPQIMNRLIKMGFKLNDACGLINSHIHSPHPILEQILNDLIKEAPGGKGIPCLSHRNPSLLQGSIQLTYITKFKTDPGDQTTSFSILITKAFNADFDGKLRVAVMFI